MSYCNYYNPQNIAWTSWWTLSGSLSDHEIYLVGMRIYAAIYGFMEFDPAKRIDHKIQRQVDPFIIYGLDAAGQALEDSGLTDMSEEERFRAGVSIGSGIGGLPLIEETHAELVNRGPRRVSPHFVHGRLINLISGQVSIKYGLMGPNHAVVTACSTGAHSIGDAARMIRDDDADIMLAGGAEVHDIGLGDVDERIEAAQRGQDPLVGDLRVARLPVGRRGLAGRREARSAERVPRPVFLLELLRPHHRVHSEPPKAHAHL